MPHPKSAPSRARAGRWARAHAATLTALAVGALVLAAVPARAANILMTFGDPIANGFVTTTITSGGETLTDLNAPIFAADTPTTKRDVIAGRIRQQLIIEQPEKFAGWKAENVPNASLLITTPKPLQVSLRSATTGEKDRLEAFEDLPFEGRINFGATSFSGTDASGGVAIFTAGILGGGMTYEVNLSADDPELGPMRSGSEIAALLYDRLSAIVPTSLAVLSYSTGSTFFDVHFLDPEESDRLGIVFANTSTTDGLVGSLATIPEPSTLSLMALGVVGSAAFLRSLASRGRRAG